MSATAPLPQLTLKAILLGLVLSMVLAGANAYLGLFAGMTVSASIPAAVISMAILKLFRDSNILENNIVQTAASAGESLAAGVIFTLPALIILGYWNVFSYPWVAVIAGLGGLLGVLFTIPLRRSLIVGEQLAYPEGTATAEVLKVGAAPGQGAKLLAVSAVLVMAPILNLLLQAYGIGAPTAEQPNALLAPQATLMASVAQGVFGAGLPWGMVAMGVVIGAVIIAVDEVLKARGSAWRAPVLAVAVGIYLPLELATPILVGGLAAHFAGRFNRREGGDAAGRGRNGILFASGLITGEALIGILIAVPIVVSGDPDVLAIAAELPAIVGFLVVAGLVAYLYRVSTRD